MNDRTFKKRLAVYGADFTRWPGGEAEAARTCLEKSKKAQASYAVALQLDAALDGFQVPAPGNALKDRVTDAAFRAGPAPSRPAMRREEKTRREFIPWPAAFPAGAALAMAVVLFLVLGGPGQQTAPDRQSSGAPARLAEIDAFLQEWEQMVAAAERDLAQEEEMLEILVATVAAPSPEAAVETFLDELLLQEEEALWDYL